MLRKLLPLLFLFAPIAAAQNTFCAANLPCTVTGAWGFSATMPITGLLQPKNIENVKYIDTANSQGWAGADLAAWVASAFASCTNSACTVFVSGGTYSTPAASITVGVSPCVNWPGTQAQTLIFDTQARFAINNPIKVLCGGYVTANGLNPFATGITAGASLGTNPMVDMGDDVNGNINAGVSYLNLKCGALAGCTGIRGRGLNDFSSIERNLIYYSVNGIVMNGAVTTTGNVSVFGNFLAAYTGGGDGMLITSVGEARFDRNSVASVSGVSITGACFHMTGTLSPNNSNLLNLHCENFTDNALLDGAAGLNIVGLDSGGSPSTTNSLHIAAGFTGVVTCLGCGMTGGTNIVKNDITSNNIAVGSGQHGQIPYYNFSQNSNIEQWADNNGVHELLPNGSFFFDNGSAVRFRNTGATEIALFGTDQFAASQFALGTTTATPVSIYTNGVRRLQFQADGGNGFPEIAAPAATPAFDVCYGDSTAHALECSYNNGTFFQIPQVIKATSSAFATATGAGTCVQNTTAVTGATTAMAVTISPVSTPGIGAQWSAFVSSAGNVTINECAVAASAGGTIAFNIRVTP